MFPDMDKLEKSIDRAVAYINTLKSENQQLKDRIKELEDAQSNAKEVIDKVLEKIQQIMR